MWHYYKRKKNHNIQYNVNGCIMLKIYNRNFGDLLLLFFLKIFYII